MQPISIYSFPVLTQSARKQEDSNEYHVQAYLCIPIAPFPWLLLQLPDYFLQLYSYDLKVDKQQWQNKWSSKKHIYSSSAYANSCHM